MFKGSRQVGTLIEFLQAGGEVETPDFILKADGSPLLTRDHTYVVFLKSLPQFSAPVLNYNNYGVFEIVRSRIVPFAAGPGWNERRDMSEERFADDLKRMRMERARPAK